jgi:sortase family protein
MRKREKRLVITIIVTIIGMIGLLGYGMYVKHNQGKLIQSYESHVEKNVNDTEDDVVRAEAYNKVIQDFVRNRGNSSTVNSLKDYDNIFAKNDGMIGILTIPKSDVRLPIYHGTEDEVLDKGVGHVSDTAFPMDTVGTKSVLTGHNGMPGADMLFTRLDETEIGDTFSIQIGDMGYHYKVKQITVITPEEAEKYAQEPIGENENANVTLITCTPYGINTHRLLVIGEFVEKAKVTENKDFIPNVGFSIGKETIVILVIIGIGLSIIGLVVYKAKKGSKNGESDNYDGYEVESKYWDVD